MSEVPEHVMPEQTGLGVDPQPEADLFEAPEEAETSPEAESETQPELGYEPPSKDEYELMQQKAAYYDQLDSDPQVVNIIRDYYNNRVKSLDTEPTSSDTAPSENVPQDIKNRLEQQDRLIRGLFAKLELQDFQSQHPDLNDIKKDVSDVMAKHPTFDIKEAYEFVKLRKGGSMSEKTSSPLVSSETQTRNVAVDSGGSEQVTKNVMKAKDLSSAFDVALSEAINQNQS